MSWIPAFFPETEDASLQQNQQLKQDAHYQLWSEEWLSDPHFVGPQTPSLILMIAGPHKHCPSPSTKPGSSRSPHRSRRAKETRVVLPGPGVGAGTAQGSIWEVTVEPTWA